MSKKKERDENFENEKEAPKLSSSVSQDDSKKKGVVEAAESKVQKRRKLMAISYKKGPTGVASKSSSSAARAVAAKKANLGEEPTIPARYFMCMYTKRSNKKHKVYEDGVISVDGNIVKLFDMDAKMIGKTNSYSVQNLSDLHAGNELYVGSKELEVANPIDPDKFISGQIFRSANVPIKMENPMVKKETSNKKFKNLGSAKNLDVEKKEIVLAPRYDPNGNISNGFVFAHSEITKNQERMLWFFNDQSREERFLWLWIHTCRRS